MVMRPTTISFVVTALFSVGCDALFGIEARPFVSEAGTSLDAASRDGSRSGTDGGSSRDASKDDSGPHRATDAGADGSDGAAEGVCDGGSCDAGCDSLTTEANCGACGYACVNGRQCTAGHCTPAWLPMTAVNAPTPRLAFQGAAAGGDLIIVGGSSTSCPESAGSLASAAQYDPIADAWTTLPNLHTARAAHVVVSSGTTVYAFGGLTTCANGTTQLANLETWSIGDAAWTPVSGTNTPAPGYAMEAAWSGSSLWIYGGSSGSSPYVTSGSVYDPVSNAWTDASCPLANCDRNDGSTILDQGYLRTWAGGGGSTPGGLEYQVSTGSWATWTMPANFPSTLGNPADDGRRIYLPSGGGSSNLDIVIYDRHTQAQTTDTATSPVNMSAAGAIAWTGSEVVLWSGSGSTEPTSAGGRYQPPAPE